MKKIHLLILSFVLISANVYSSDQHEVIPKQTTNQTQTEQAGTEKNPITIKILPSKDAETNSAKEEEYRKEKSMLDEKLVDATVWLFRVTTALALFTLGLWVATICLAKDARETSRRQADEVKRSLEISNEQIKLAREEFIATHRPRLKLRHFTVLGDIIPFNDFAWEMSIFNIGDTTPREIVITYIAMWAENASEVISAFRNTQSQKSEIVKVSISPGQVIKQSLPYVHVRQSIDEQTFDDIRMKFFIIGRIIYSDALNIKRNTGFFRIGDVSRISTLPKVSYCIRDFRPMEYSDYEYED